MKIHEYQGKEILRQFGVPTPRGMACFNVDEAVAAARQLGGSAAGCRVAGRQGLHDLNELETEHGHLLHKYARAYRISNMGKRATAAPALCQRPAITAGK